MLLCLTMLLCAIPFSVTATEETTATGEIKTLAELQAITGSGDYYLANDIYVDLSTVTLPLIKDGFTGTLDGKGYSILFQNETTGAATNERELTGSGGIVFNTCAAKKICDLTLGSAEVPVKLKASWANIGIVAQQSGAATTFENVTVYGEMQANRTGAMNQGFFLGKGLNNLSFLNCKAIGSLTVTAQNADAKKIGGFVGTYAPTASSNAGLTLTMEGCVSDVTITAASGITVSNSRTYVGGLVGHLACTTHPNKIKATNCISLQLPVMTNASGLSAHCDEFVGGIEADGDPVAVDAAANQVTLTNCATSETLAETLALTTDRVASIRFATPTGIRYRTTVSGLYDTLVSLCGADNVKLGTLIAPELYVTDAGSFTKEALDALTDIDSERYVEVAYGADEWYETADDAYVYTGAIAEILPANYAVNYCGIGYLTYSVDGGNTWTTIYADYAEAEGQTGIPAYSIQYLAQCAVADTEAGYTTAQLEALQKYLPADGQ